MIKTPVPADENLSDLRSQLTSGMTLVMLCAALFVTWYVLTLAVCATAAYAFAKLKYRGRDAIFWVVLSSQMIPGIVTLIPSFLVVRAIPFAGGNNWLGSGGHGWLNSFAGLIIPGAGGALASPRRNVV